MTRPQNEFLLRFLKKVNAIGSMSWKIFPNELLRFKKDIVSSWLKQCHL